jgi:hypothetical protein
VRRVKCTVSTLLRSFDNNDEVDVEDECWVDDEDGEGADIDDEEGA